MPLAQAEELAEMFSATFFMLFKRRLHKPLLFNLMPTEKPILLWHTRINNARAVRLFAIFVVACLLGLFCGFQPSFVV
jgi:hypothetical protein